MFAIQKCISEIPGKSKNIVADESFAVISSLFFKVESYSSVVPISFDFTPTHIYRVNNILYLSL